MQTTHFGNHNTSLNQHHNSSLNQSQVDHLIKTEEDSPKEMNKQRLNLNPVDITDTSIANPHSYESSMIDV